MTKIVLTKCLRYDVDFVLEVNVIQLFVRICKKKYIYKQHKNWKIILTTRKQSLYFAFTVLLTLGIRRKKSLSFRSSVILHTKPLSWIPIAKQKGMTEKHLESGNKSRYESVGRTCTWQESTRAAQNSGFSYMKYNSCFVLLLSIYIFFSILL